MITKRRFHNSTDKNNSYSVHHATTTQRLCIRVYKAIILLKLKAGDIIVMTGDIFMQEN